MDCGIRIYGGVGRRKAEKSFRLQFTRTYGPTELHYPLFGEGATDRFDQLVLRANFNDAYTWGGNRSQYIRDEFVRQLQLALGQLSPHGTFVHLYINGLYWGLYNPTERPESSFAATYFGGDKEDWDALNSGRPLGTSTATNYNAMLSLARQGMESNINYQKIQGNNPDGTRNPQYVDYLDLDNYIDYMLLNIFVGNKDWPVHNWYAAMNRVETSGWKWFTWDAEWVMGMNSGVTDNITNVNTYLCEPYSRLRANPEFCLRSPTAPTTPFSMAVPCMWTRRIRVWTRRIPSATGRRPCMRNWRPRSRRPRRPSRRGRAMPKRCAVPDRPMAEPAGLGPEHVPRAALRDCAGPTAQRRSVSDGGRPGLPDQRCPAAGGRRPGER